MHQARAQGDRPRLVFLDVARGLAIVLMVFGHVSDSVVAPMNWQSSFGQSYLNVRGFTAPLFFLVSGWAFAIATLPRFEEHRRLGPLVKARLRRALVLVFWGSALTVPWWADGFPFHAGAKAWRPFMGFGVLHCIASALLVGQMLVRIASSRRSFGWIALLAAAMAIAGAPYVQNWGGSLPSDVRGAFVTGSFLGGFPLLPWGGFFWFGSGLGALASVGRWSAPATAAALAAISSIALALGFALDDSCRAWLGDGWLASVSPSVMLVRLGAVAGILAVLLVVTLRGGRAIERWVRLPSAHALTFYVGHMLLIWGAPGSAGLSIRVGQTLSFAESAGLVAASLAALWAAAWLVNRARGAAGKTLPNVVRALRTRSPQDGDVFVWPRMPRGRKGIGVCPSRLIVNGRAYPLTSHTRIEAEPCAPSAAPAVTVLLLGTAGIPAAILFNRVTPQDHSWLVGFTLFALLAAGFRAVSAKARYRVVLRTRETVVPIIRGKEHRAALSLVSAVRDGIAALEPRRARDVAP